MNNDSHVVSVAPDALVYINGKDGFSACKGCSCDVKLRDVITQINVDLSITSTPGSATISIANPQHLDVPLIYKTESVFSSMQEVEIFMKGYFLQNGENVYHPVFWGFISAVNESYNDGVFNITLSCKDILRWWEISKVNTSPSQLYTENFFPSTDVQIFQNVYSTMSIADIVFQISKITVNELLKIDNITGPATTSEHKRDYVKANTELMQYWKDRFLQIGKNLRVYGYTGNTLNIETVDLTTNFKNIEGIQTLSNKIPDSLDAVGVNGPEINKFIPENLQTKQGEGLQDNSYETKLATVNRIKENIQYEFFMDPTGEILFKPPFYNVDVRNNPIHVVQDVELLEFNFSEDETPVITRVEVTGSMCAFDHSSNTTTAVWDYWVDYYLVRQYGNRVQPYTNPWLRTREQCKIYAISELSRINAMLKTGSVNIIGRPEARLGYPIYVVAKDAFYYVTGVAHSFSFGGSFTTTLTLAGERKKIFDGNGIVQKNLAMKFITEKPEDAVVERTVGILKKEKALDPSITYESIKTRMDVYLNQNKQIDIDIKNKVYFSNSKDYLNELDSILNKNENALSKENRFLNTNLLNQIPGTLIPPKKYTDAQIYEILRIIGELDEFKKIDSPNSLMRIKNDDAKINPAHFATRTVNAIPFSGGQEVYFVNEPVETKFVGDFFKNGIQITDKEGYSLVGAFNYGRNLNVLPSSKIGPKKLTEIERPSSRLAESAFNVTLSGKQNTEPSSNKPENITGEVNDPSVLASGISIRSWDASCSCNCHGKYNGRKSLND